MYLYRIQPSRPEMLSDIAMAEKAAVISEHFAGYVILNKGALHADINYRSRIRSSKG